MSDIHIDRPIHPIKLEPGQIIPTFTLPGPDGMPHSPWDYKQREHLIIFLAHHITTPGGREILSALARHYMHFREEYCAVLAVTVDPVITNLHTQDQLHLPFPLLSDAQSHVLPRYTQMNNETETFHSSIVLADRYNALYQQWIEQDEHSLPSITELLEHLQYLNRLCTP